MSKKLKDYVVEGDQAALQKHLDKIIEEIVKISTWVETNIERTERKVLLCNFLSSISLYLEVAKTGLNSHISVLALATRSIYEINLRLRLVTSSEEELKKWASEGVTDNIQVLEGILLLNNEAENIAEKTILNNEIERLKKLIVKYSMPVVKSPESTANIAKIVGFENEHKGLFKLYSKLVHPSSYLVNCYNNAQSIENQKILQIHAQLYAHDSIEIISKVFNVPHEIRTLNIKA